MFTYPQLSPAEQANLPKLIAEPIAIPNKFDDSTHQIWHCQTIEGEMVLKVCNDATIAESPFWLGVNHLFAADFPNSLGNIHLTHDFLAQNGVLKVPDFIGASANRFVLSRFLPGVDLEVAKVEEKWVIALANHIATLHQITYKKWGSLHAPQFSIDDWAERLHETLSFLAKQRGATIAESLFREILVQAKNIQETEFIPMMLDLRWDQLRYLNANELALVDLDAFVIAPRALDLVLLEYIFTPQQFALFKQHYVQTHTWPDNKAQKSCYQLLLFLMNVLGETDLPRWMNRI
jgi:hypothetical protein